MSDKNKIVSGEPDMLDEEELQDQQGKRKVRVKVKRAPKLRRSRSRIINVIDVIIIIIALALVASLIAGINFGEKLFSANDGSKRTIEYTVMFSGVDESLADAIKNTDPVYSEDGTLYLGQISTEVEVDSYKVVGYRDGVAEMKVYPDKVNLTVTIRVEANYTEGVGYSVGDRRIALGATYKMRFPALLAQGECININANIA